jgi:hypothetical protein
VVDGSDKLPEQIPAKPSKKKSPPVVFGKLQETPIDVKPKEPETITEFSFNEGLATPPPEEDSFADKLSSLKKGIFDEQTNSAAFGMLYKNRSGTAGMSTLDTIVLPALDVQYHIGLSHKLYGHINFLNMTNGMIPESDASFYGLPNRGGGNLRSISSLIEPMVGYQYTGGDWIFTGEVGTTPSPSQLPESKTLWNFKYTKKGKGVEADIAYVNKSVTDTLLSRVGDTYFADENNETLGVRGGVTKEGFIFGGKYSNDEEVFAGNVGFYYDVSGYLVEPNKELAMTLLYVRQIKVPDFLFVMVGPIFIYDNYTFNSNYFTMAENEDGTHIGNGGYFSPNNFILLGVYFDFAQIATKRFLWRVKGNVGITNFTNKEDLFGIVPSGTAGGIGYDVKGFIGYKFEPEIQILAGVGRASSGTFSTMFLGLSAVYYFGGKMNNNAEDLLRSNIIKELVQ